MPDIGLTHVALPVRSLDASLDFYARYAGMHAVHRRHGVLWLSDCTRAFAIVLIQTDGPIEPLRPMAHLGVGVASRDEVDRLCALSRADGCLLREAHDSGPPVGYWALLRDPDGHTLELAHGQELGLAVDGAGRADAPGREGAGAMPIVAVVTTVGSLEAARTLAHELVERRLVACAQLTPMESVYHWGGDVLQEPEVRLVLKTTAGRCDAVLAAVRERHPYALPDLHVEALQHVHPPYAAWVEAETAASGPGGA